MALPISIFGDCGKSAAVSGNGEVRVAPLKPNQLLHNKMDTIDTAYVFAIPFIGQRMIMENVLISTDNFIGVNGADVTIYLATTPDATTGTTLMEFNIPKNHSRDIVGLNLAIDEGFYLLAKTNDATVYATMMGYYEDV